MSSPAAMLARAYKHLPTTAEQRRRWWALLYLRGRSRHRRGDTTSTGEDGKTWPRRVRSPFCVRTRALPSPICVGCGLQVLSELEV